MNLLSSHHYQTQVKVIIVGTIMSISHKKISLSLSKILNSTDSHKKTKAVDDLIKKKPITI